MLGGGLAEDRAGIVHQNVDDGMAGQHAAEEFVNGAAAGEIAGVGGELSAKALDLALDGAAGQLKRLADADDVRAGFRQRHRHGFSDTALAASDERGLAIQTEQVESLHPG
jgi:hypothetical protein